MYKVLIVEDDPMVAMINEQYVKKSKEFIVVGKCSDGKSALSFLESNEVNLIILDVYMPHMSGVELLKIIREKQIPVDVIMVTAANDRTTLEDTLHLGIIDYLVKPFAYERFKMALEKYSVHMKMLDDVNVLNQQNIDYIMEKSRQKNEGLHPKGIQSATLNNIYRCMQKAEGWKSAEYIANETGLSIVTIRRYMAYLVETGQMLERINYETGGRPCFLYKMA